jgi:hypothetical protein
MGCGDLGEHEKKIFLSQLAFGNIHETDIIAPENA